MNNNEYLWEMEYLAYLDRWMADPTDRMPLTYVEWRNSVDPSLVENQEG